MKYTKIDDAISAAFVSVIGFDPGKHRRPDNFTFDRAAARRAKVEEAARELAGPLPTVGWARTAERRRQKQAVLREMIRRGLTAKQIADVLCVSATRVYQMASDMGLPFRRARK